jgi:pyruvate dehydrogenase E1 component
MNEPKDSPAGLQAPPQTDGETERKWLESLANVVEYALRNQGPERAARFLDDLTGRLRAEGVEAPRLVSTPYLNTIPVEKQAPFPGNWEMERRLKSLVRWNAMAMVVNANREHSGLGGHISTYASCATLLEVAFNHFLRARTSDFVGDMVFFQGHATPGVYARAFLERRLDEQHLHHFRQELAEGGGLSSYPHPYLMPDFWQFPTVSMGLGPLLSIYQARFNRYLRARGLTEGKEPKVWTFLGDGETDEPETLGSITLAARENLDNLIWVVNCNLQRLDGPVRGNGKIVNELEAAFRGAGWNVIKLLWGSDWDDLLARDHTGLLQKRMEECVDGEYQAFKAKGGAFIRKEFFGKYPETLKLVEHMTDEQVGRLRRGGHDPVKVYNAYLRAVQTTGMPTVILAKTVKGYGLPGESRNPAHQEKKLAEEALAHFRTRFEIPVSDEVVEKIGFFRPADDSPETIYLQERRKALGGHMPLRENPKTGFEAPPLEFFAESLTSSKDRAVSSTMAFVALLRNLLKHPKIGKQVVPIVPDEGRTFGMESMIRQVGIYASQGQLYIPHDQDMVLYYREAKDGQMLEEGITEAGSMASFTAAGTAYSNYGVDMIPFFTYYSMFGFQRVGDMIWAFADSRGKGFLMGGTAGRTSLSGEGLQHCDGHSVVLASTVPTCAIYDPAYSYELAVVIQDGLRRMYQQREDLFYYITVYNDNYPMPQMPEGCREGILKGIYRFQAAPDGKAVVQLFGSGPILNEAVRAQAILAGKYNVQADVWSVTSYNELRREAMAIERWNRLHPLETARTPHILTAVEAAIGPIIAATDYMKIVPDQLAPWLGERLVSLGTDGFGRSDNREHLRRHFEVNAESIAAAALSRLSRDGKFPAKKAVAAMQEMGVNPEKVDPARA